MCVFTPNAIVVNIHLLSGWVCKLRLGIKHMLCMPVGLWPSDMWALATLDIWAWGLLGHWSFGWLVTLWPI